MDGFIEATAGSESEGSFRVLFRGDAGEEEDFEARFFGFDSFEDLEARHFGDIEVEEDKVWFGFLDFL